MKYIKSLLQLKKKIPEEILYSKMVYHGVEWSDLKNRKRDKVTDFEISEIKKLLKNLDIPCKHGKMCPTCPDATVFKKIEQRPGYRGDQRRNEEVIVIKRSETKYEIRKYVDEWYSFASGVSTFKCDTIDGVKQILKKISKHEMD